MDINIISGEAQYDLLKKFQYIREAGTPKERIAAEGIQNELQNIGLFSRLEEFEITKSIIEKQSLLVTEPYEKEYQVSAYYSCGSTPIEGIEAPFLYVENGDEISLTYAKGKIVMVNGVVKKDLYQKLIDAEGLGFVTISGTPIDVDQDLKPMEYTLRGVADTPLQGVNIHYRDAVELVEREASRVRITLQQRKETFVSQNVVSRIDGKDKAEEILSLSAHYDSVAQGPGAYDNMAGAAIILELAKYFKDHLPRRTLEFIWFGAEELGLCGSKAYVKDHERELDRHQFNMNVDLAGQLVGGTVIGVTARAEVIDVLASMVKETKLGASFIHGVWSSDSNTFAWKGVPAMTLNRDGFGMHTRHDTIDLISPWSLKRSAIILGAITEGLANVEFIPWRKEIPEDFVDKLSVYFSNC